VASIVAFSLPLQRNWRSWYLSLIQACGNSAIRRLRAAFDALVERSCELSALSLEASKRWGKGDIASGA